jgi:type II secretory pathway predicted ATPase ExeA
MAGSLEEFYGLQFDPFVPSCRSLEHEFPAKDFKEALGRFKKSAREEGVNLLMGRPGCGISFATGYAAKELEAAQYTVRLVNVLHISPRGILKTICGKIGADPNGKVREALIPAIQERALALKEKHRPLCLIIANAQNLPGEMIDDLPHLAALDYPPVNLITLMLCGTRETENKIKDGKAMGLRVSEYYTMYGLDPGEVPAYVLHKLKMAGAQQNIMDEEALNSLYDYSSNGNYRKLNKLVHDAMYLGAQTGREVIDRNTIRSAVAYQF